MEDKRLVIAALPAFNEEHSIAKMVLGCRKYVDKVVVIDDGSFDATGEIAEALGATVVRHSENRGYGASLQTIFLTAREMGVDSMVVIDSDGQHDPKDIPKLLEPLENGADLVIGSRFINGKGGNVPVYRKVGMKVLDKATNISGGVRVSDSQSGYRAYSRLAIDKIQINGNDMSAGSEILLQVKDKDLKVEEVEINCDYNVKDASSQNPISHGVKVLVQILRDMEFRRPLYYFTVPGMIFTIIGLGMGINVYKWTVATGRLPIGPTLFMITAMLIGILSVFTGLILHSISRLLYEYSMDKK